MSYDDDRTQQIRLGQAINLAWQYGLNGGAATFEDAVTSTKEYVQEALALINEIENTEAVILAFPGSQVVAGPTGGQPVLTLGLPATPEPAPIIPQPAPVPGVTDGDPTTAALWILFFSDPTAFWDNRKDKRNPRAPDFKHKNSGDALWIIGKKNPSWVPGQLAARGLG